MKYNWIYALSLTDGAFATQEQSLPWDTILEDMKFFVQKTKGQVVICSRGTLMSIVKKQQKPIQNVIEKLTKNRSWYVLDDQDFGSIPRFTPEVLKKHPDQEVFVIGGRRAFRIFNDPQKIYLNLILFQNTKNPILQQEEPVTTYQNYEICLSEQISDRVISCVLRKKANV